MARVYNFNKPTKEVQDLGWLLAHKHAVEEFVVLKSAEEGYDCWLQATLDNGSTHYCINFADKVVLHQFLNRPSWRDVPIFWQIEIGCVFAPPILIGSEQYDNLLTPKV